MLRTDECNQAVSDSDSSHDGALARWFWSNVTATLAGWSLRPVVEALMALRGVDLVTAMTVLAELGDIRRHRKVCS